MSNSIINQSTLNVLDIFFQSLAPFDIVLAKFFRNNRWIGASDRRAIADLSYSIFRNYELLKFHTSSITEKLGRFFVLTYFKLNNLPIGDLSNFEKKFLDSIHSDRPPHDHVRLNYPQWMDAHFRRAFQSQFDQEMLTLNAKASVDLRINTLKATYEQVAKLLEASGFQVQKLPLAANGLRIINGRRLSRSHEIIVNGFAEIQDEGSQLVAEVCAVENAKTVVDFCAGAGGKTLALAAAMQNKGRIFALDKYEERLENAKRRFRKANVNNVFCQAITSKWLKRHRGCADVVLVDAPCSGVGTWRRNPDMRAKFFPRDLEELLSAQAEILATAQRLVKDGGRLVYATCSVLVEENEDQMEAFLKKFPEFTSEKINLGALSGDPFLKLSPFRHGADGFFVASFRKTP